MATTTTTTQSESGSVFKTETDHVDHDHGRRLFKVDEQEILAHVAEFDDAVEAVKGQDLDFTDDEHRRVLRKIDWHLMPVGAWACGLQFIDKTALGAAATYGMSAELRFQGSQYSWCVAAFYFGYLFAAPVHGRCLQRFHAGKWIALNFVLWGGSLLAMLGVKNFAGVFVCRILLGVFEAALVPGLTLMTSMWYTHKEQPMRFGLWGLMNGIAPIPFLCIYYALGHVDSGPLPPWRLIFLLVGLLSCVTGAMLYFTLPDSPLHVSWLSEREKAIAIQRVSVDQTGVKNATFKWDQAREAFTDWHVWLIVLMFFFSQAAGSVTSNFLGILIKGFGYTALKAQLFTVPNFAVFTVTQILVCFPPSFVPFLVNKKQPLMAMFSLIAVAGMAILFAAEATAATRNLRLAGCIIISTSQANYSGLLIVIGTNVAGFTKKQVVTSMCFVAYSVINIVTPQTFLTREAPRYHTGLGFVMACLCIFIALAWISWGTMLLENRRRDKLALTDSAYATGADNLDLLSGLRDATERHNGHFRYSG